MKKKVTIIIQARLNSSRLPNKVLKSFEGINLTYLLFERIKKTKLADNIVFSIPDTKINDKLYFYIVKELGCNVFRGSEKNVLNRFYETAKKFKSSTVVRITGDCPFLDHNIIDKFINKFSRHKVDYLSNIYPATFPDGLDIEVFSFEALKTANNNAKSIYEREHVTAYIRNSKKFKIKNIFNSKDLSFLKFSIDTSLDFLKAKKIIKFFKKNINFSYNNLLKIKNLNKLFKKELLIENINKNKTRTGQMLWNKAKKIIPGGNMLLSKNPERYLPEHWPTYYQSAKGCSIKDFDGNNFLDFSLMGVGTNVLGYSNNFIDNEISKTIKLGNMSTLNCAEEILLAEKLIELHPWFHQVKFARTGGEANAIAIRIARAASGRDNVAFCGYHGWHDWYLSSNLELKKNKNLDNHLLKGLEIGGVPKKLKKTSFPFEYGNKEQLTKIVKKNKIGIIKMEVCKNTTPNINFLKFVRELANKNNIVLIYDECTTGFRQTYGGLHKSTKVIPDIAIFGKALGNGYAITAIVGKKDVMQAADKSFISSTFWTERIGSVAALKTLEYMKKYQTWNIIKEKGKLIQKRWAEISKQNDVEISINGIYSLSSFIFKSKMHQKYKTLITQEMLKSNMLASNVLYPSIAHKKNLLDKYFSKMDQIFKIIKKCEQGSDIRKYLKTKISLKDFKRLN